MCRGTVTCRPSFCVCLWFQIAAAKSIREDTVLGYLGDVLLAGFPVDVMALGVDVDTMTSVRNAVVDVVLTMGDDAPKDADGKVDVTRIPARRFVDRLTGATPFHLPGSRPLLQSYCRRSSMPPVRFRGYRRLVTALVCSGGLAADVWPVWTGDGCAAQEAAAHGLLRQSAGACRG